MKEPHEGMQTRNGIAKVRWEEEEAREAEKQEAEVIQGGSTAKHEHTGTLAQYRSVTPHSDNQQSRSHQNCCTTFLWEKQGSS